VRIPANSALLCAAMDRCSRARQLAEAPALAHRVSRIGKPLRHAARASSTSTSAGYQRALRFVGVDVLEQKRRSAPERPLPRLEPEGHPVRPTGAAALDRTVARREHTAAATALLRAAQRANDLCPFLGGARCRRRPSSPRLRCPAFASARSPGRSSASRVRDCPVPGGGRTSSCPATSRPHSGPSSPRER